MRFLSFILVVSSGILVGYENYSMLKKRIVNLGEFVLFLYEIETNLSFYLDDITTIIRNSKNKVAEKIGSYMDSEDIYTAFENAAKLLFPLNKDREFFLRFIKDFGRSDLNSQLSNIQKYITKTEEKYQEAEKELALKGKTGFIFSFFISFSLGLIFL